MRKVILVSVLWIAGCGSSSGGVGPEGNDGGPGPTNDATTGSDATDGTHAGGDDGAADATTGADDGRADVEVPGDASIADGEAGADAGTDGGGDADSATPGDSGADSGSNDAARDAAEAATCPKTLLAGGTDISTQGWSTVTQAPETLTYGADYVRLATSTNGGAATSGQLLIDYPGAFTSGEAFKVQIVMRVESVNAHNQSDSAAAIMGSFHSPFGNSADRSEMVYLDSAAIGWADDSASAAVAVTDGNYHTYELSVDTAGTAIVSVDGAAKLTRSGFVTNGTLAIGDQTNDANVDSAIRIRSVTKLCP